MSLKASISGIRGVIGESLTPQIIVDYVSAFASILPDGDIVIGRDSRPSGPCITDMVKSVLNSMGRNVVDVGIVPTPTVLFLVGSIGYAGGIVITASHNPIQWNALKLVNSKGRFLSPSEFGKLSDVYNLRKFNYCSYDKIGVSENKFSMSNLHIDNIMKFVDAEKIASRKFKVVLDTVNGAGGPISITLLEKLGCEVIAINTETTGVFAHPPEPTPVNLKELSENVKKHSADIGFALDPDGDRLVLCGSDGVVLSEEYTLAVAVRHYISTRGKTPVVINLSTSRLSVDSAQSMGCEVIKVPTGEIHVTEKLFEIGAKIGGEGNGGIIIPEVNSCRDALSGMAVILEALSFNKCSIEKLSEECGSYVLIKEKVETSDFNADNAALILKNKFPDGIINTEDGLRIDFETGWVLIRKSNTEPIVRVFAEEVTTEKCESLISQVREAAGL